MKTKVPERVAEALASAFLAHGAWTRDALAERGRVTLAEDARWMRGVVDRVLATFPEPPRARFSALARFIASVSIAAPRERRAPRWRPKVARWLEPEIAMGVRRWDVPAIATPGDLARWLGLSPAECDWFADGRGLERLRRPEALDHYRRRWVAKRRGGFRLLEAPKARTKAVQQRILREILDRVPAHDAAHGFVRGRSVRTHAALHVGRAVVVRLDLEDFFLSISAARVAGVFRAAGYPDDVAWSLTLLCTNVAPPSGLVLGRDATHDDVARLRRAEMRARTRHLPQGAPTSPALANLCARGLDVRLTALATKLGAVYTRYADDMTFSGDRRLARSSSRLEAWASAIASDEGFTVNHRKSRVMRAGVRQLVTGVVVNTRLNVARDAYDRLEATLHNCRRLGPGSQNRDGHPDFRAHLVGRVAHVKSLHPARGEKLAALLEQIAW
ncbi:MAG: RNA-directed DNA polymerase [Labilithrix sp.]|nr:RNA-directed DNA polymerase [Labilithrix sp.]